MEVFRGGVEQEVMTAEQGMLLRAQMDEPNFHVEGLVEDVHVLVVAVQKSPQGCAQVSTGQH